jgi:hypothetical protein
MAALVQFWYILVLRRVWRKSLLEEKSMVFGRRFLIGSLATGLTLLSLSTVSAYADVVTGFEPPAYTPGALNGQNGWSVFGPGLVTVENTFAFAGSQAVFVDGGPGTTSQSGPYLADTAGPIVDLSAEIWLSSSSAETGWQFADVGAGLSGFAGGIDISPTADPLTNTISPITAGASAPIGIFTRDQWNNVQIILNFTTQTSSIVLNGVTLASNLPFCGNNGPICNGAPVSNIGADGFFDTFGGVSGSDDDGFIDNYSDVTVSSTPEPAFGGFLGLAFAGLAVIRRKRLC